MSVAEALHARWSPDAGEHEHVVFLVEGMHCAGCARSIDKAVRALPGVLGVRVNNATARVSVEWSGRGETGLTQILGAVTRAGFRPVPLAGATATAEFQRGRRAALKRLGLASLGMMQAMMYLSALYGVNDIDATMAQLMRVTGMIIVTPVLFYSGAPFLAGAWRDLANRRLGMDIPVALALLLAWLPSVANTLLARGEVYFDSVGMFIFFLSAGRFVEMNVRHRSLSSTEALARSLPTQVTRVSGDRREKITAAELAVGDRFLVPKGAVVAVDAELDPDALETHVSLDESLITGESAAVLRGKGERIRGGTVNLGAPVILRATAVVGESTLASMVKLLERAQATRPQIARAADRVATWFVAVILLLAVATALAWWRIDPTRAFGAVLAVLVVTCPCALSLATPAALAAATTRLARLGLLVTRADAIERLARVDTVVFDKTGTLTGNATGVQDVKLLATLSREQVLAIAAALERGSSHPLAEAFRPFDDSRVSAAAIRESEGQGVEGIIDGVTWRLGRRRFVEELSVAAQNSGRLVPLHARGTQLYLGSDRGLAAEIEVGIPLRADARQAIDTLRHLGLEIVIASGDSSAAVASAARTLDIRRSYSRLGPDDKIRLVHDLHVDSHRVFVVGDGINDGPVLAAADVSCAMGQGSAIAQSASDLLLVHDGLAVLPRAIATARTTLRVMRQNLGWSLAYNIAAVPLAALGLVSPWLAALGMSLSSLGVVLNARRLAGRA